MTAGSHIDAKQEMFRNRLQKVWKHFSKLARRQNVSCFRFYDHDMPEFPFALEWLDGVVYGAEYKRRHGMSDDEHAQWLEGCKTLISTVTATAESNIILKQRQRKAGRQGQYEKQAAEKREHIVREGGLSFILNLTDYLDSGLFLDHRETRNMVRQESAGKKVLNLFCYTGSFSVYAAHGGAQQVTSVDLSKTYIHWARRNMQYNKLYKTEHEFVQADVLEWLESAPAGHFDIIVCDPPTFSNSKKMDGDFDVQRDHAVLVNRLLSCCAQHGKIYFSNNYRGFEIDQALIQASVTDITRQTTPFDFQGRLCRKCYLISR